MAGWLPKLLRACCVACVLAWFPHADPVVRFATARRMGARVREAARMAGFRDSAAEDAGGGGGGGIGRRRRFAELSRVLDDWEERDAVLLVGEDVR